jgi:thymidine phosphorylase
MAMLSEEGRRDDDGVIGKLESISGFDASLTHAGFRRVLKSAGMAVSSATERIAPVEKQIRALQRASGTVESVGLTAASILSRKLALRTDGIVFDIKCGNSALTRTEKEAKELAGCLLAVSRRLNRPARAVITSMSQPLGYHIGTYLEVVEAVLFLQGRQIDDIAAVTFALGAQILNMAEIERSRKRAVDLMKDRLTSGEALNRFRELVSACGGSVSMLDNPNEHHEPKASAIVLSPADGFISALDIGLIEEALAALGATRARAGGKSDPHAGVILYHKVGDKVEKSEPLMAVFADNRKKLAEGKTLLQSALQFGKSPPGRRRTVLRIVK